MREVRSDDPPDAASRDGLRSGEASAAGEGLAEAFADHLQAVSAAAETALEVHARAAGESRGEPFAGIVFHAGSPSVYHADDMHVLFRPVPHFARFAPLPGPDHLLLFRPGEPLRVVRVAPADYWEEPPAVPDHPVVEAVDLREAPSLEAAAVVLGDVSGCAYVGSSPAVAARLSLPDRAVEPRTLMAPLDWHRAFKTRYEVRCIREANRRAAVGHAAVRAAFEAESAPRRPSERELHAAYLAATGHLESETPYPNIIACDAGGSVLHYQAKRTAEPSPGHTLLIDAGATVHGYASDITRTYARRGAHPLFLELLDRMEELQQRLVAAVRPGGSYEDLHGEAVRGVAALLSEHGVLRVGRDEAFARDLALPFLPHGLGHHLGLQVHDVGGQQVTPEGLTRPPQPLYPTLRTTRDLDVGHVVTIEPGLYFIPVLLEPHRSGPDAAAFDWSLIDALLPCGGIRIEDDVHLTPDGAENLTRPYVPGHADPPGSAAAP